MAFAQIYICPEHGEVGAYKYESIDCQRDDIEYYMLCEKCNRQVKPKMIDGKPVMRALTEDEIRDDMGFYDEEDYEDDPEDDDYYEWGGSGWELM